MPDSAFGQTHDRFSDPIVRSGSDAVNRYRPRMAVATGHEHGLYIDGESV